MRKRAVLAPILLMLISAGTAAALDGGAWVRCEDGQHTVSVSGSYVEEYDGVIDGIVFKREVIGLCAEPQYLPDPPLPFKPQPDYANVYYYQASMPIDDPTTHFSFRYTPYGVRPDGTLVPTTYSCDADYRNYALASCGGAPIGRGRLEYNDDYDPGFYLTLVHCTESCWNERIWLYPSEADAVSEEPIGDLIGNVVDIYGNRTFCSMPLGDAYHVSRIESAPTGTCTSLPVREHTWGSLKATFD